MESNLTSNLVMPVGPVVVALRAADRASKGRNEDGDLWWKRHDEYEDKGVANGASRTGVKRSTSNAQHRIQNEDRKSKDEGASKDCCA
jgi:hypothetical protein